ncbi:hypothetical protein Pfo_023658 [Paulownia fortunei]|nr:hypothetical protein Pfo_023658 [Paulownia fortunei]
MISAAKSANDEGSTFCTSANVVLITQKVIAEEIGTYFLIFVGCGSVAVNKIYGSVTFPGVCVAWGLTVMVMVYAVVHISGAHFNPAVPLYILAQLLGSLLWNCASGIQRTIPGDRIHYILSLDVCHFWCCYRQQIKLAGIAIGMTILINSWVYIVGPLLGTIMGGFAYNLIRFTDKPLREITKS